MPRTRVAYNQPQGSNRVIPLEQGIGETQLRPILFLPSHDRQLWTDTIDRWKNQACQAYLMKRQFGQGTGEDCFGIMEGYLGPSVKSLWETYKVHPDTRQKYQNLMGMGADPLNFVNAVSEMLTSADPNIGQTKI